MNRSTSTAHLVADAQIKNTVRYVLMSRGIPRHELDDAVCEVQVCALEAAARGTTPATARDWKALCVDIATKYAIKEGKKRKARRKYDAGPCDDPDGHSVLVSPGAERDPVDKKRQIEVLAAQLEASGDPERALLVLDAIAAGEKQSDIAEEIGMAPRQLRKSVETIRRRFRTSVAALGMSVLVLLMMVLFAAPLGTVASNTAPPPAPPAPTHPVEQPPAPSPAQLAETLRREGLDACARSDWTTCGADLDAAQALGGRDETPAVRAAHERANERLLEELRELDAKPPLPHVRAPR